MTRIIETKIDDKGKKGAVSYPYCSKSHGLEQILQGAAPDYRTLISSGLFPDEK